MFLVGLGQGLIVPNAAAGIVSVNPKLAGSASGLGATIQVMIGGILAYATGYIIADFVSPLPLIGILFFTILGAIAGSFFGKLYHRVVDAVLSKIPGLNSIYNTVKQIIDTFATTQSNAFKEVVLIEYPQKDIFALAFLTSETKGEIAKRKNQKMINVFMPSTPNPTTGFLMFVPLSKCTKLNMSVDQAIKYIISAGLVTPKAPEIKKALPKKKKIKKLTK